MEQSVVKMFCGFLQSIFPDHPHALVHLESIFGELICLFIPITVDMFEGEMREIGSVSFDIFKERLHSIIVKSGNPIHAI
jgi:hypothetical protein